MTRGTTPVDVSREAIIEAYTMDFMNSNREIRMNGQVGNPADREITLTRVIDAPRELVWEAWTDPDRIGKWFGPNGFTITVHEMVVRPGGEWRFIMHGPDGTDYKNLVVYKKVEKPERLLFSHGGYDEDASGPQFQTTVTFVEKNGGTEITLRQQYDTAAERDKSAEFGAIELGNQTLAKLERYLTEESA